ncbi:MAG: hypothetical protein AB1791_21530 [Chloroflexota bacterium]
MLDQIIAITNVSAKHWQPFEITSPGGIPFAGYLCRQESEKLGLLAVTEMDGRPRLELIYAMPKIHYPYQVDQQGVTQIVIPVTKNVVDARFTLKLDGTAIIFYPLTDPEGKVLEVVPRTRLQPVISPSRWGDWASLLAEVLPDRRPVEQAIRDQNVVLVFELWGYRNPHLIKYTTPLALTLHTAIRHKKVVSYRRLADFAGRYGFDLIPSLEVTTPDLAGLAQAYRRLQEQMEAHNRAAGQDVYVEEGAILVLSTTETATYYKCKPPSIEEIHWTAGQHLSKEIIQHALYKMLENGYDFANGRVEDLKVELAADFEEPEIAYADDLIQRLFLDFSIELQRKEWLRQLVNSSGLDPHDLPALMRYLSQHYAKKEMGWVYAAVKELVG